MRTTAHHLDPALPVPAAHFCEDRAGARWIDLVSVLDKRQGIAVKILAATIGDARQEGWVRT
jgi:hypothetical protein